MKELGPEEELPGPGSWRREAEEPEEQGSGETGTTSKGPEPEPSVTEVGWEKQPPGVVDPIVTEVSVWDSKLGG